MSETTRAIDAQRLTLILHELRLPAIKQVWPEFVERADREAWPAARLLAALAEHEIAERDRRRVERASTISDVIWQITTDGTTTAGRGFP